jgi:hypothetical protein
MVGLVPTQSMAAASKSSHERAQPSVQPEAHKEPCAPVNHALGNMETLKDIAEFRSKRFAPLLPEDCQVNPPAYGDELSNWDLCQKGRLFRSK